MEVNQLEVKRAEASSWRLVARDAYQCGVGNFWGVGWNVVTVTFSRDRKRCARPIRAIALLLQAC